MSIKLTDAAQWLTRELEGTGFTRTDQRGYAVVDEAHIDPAHPTAVILHFGNDRIRLTITRD
jgi:hypothetical protein